MNLLQSLTTFIKNIPKDTMAIGVIGVCSLVIAALVVLTLNDEPQTSTKPSATNPATAQAKHTQTADKPTSSEVAGSSTDTTAQPQAATTPTTKSSKPSDSKPTNNSNPGNANNNTPTPPPAPNQPTPPKPDYNLNENWYFATAMTGGLYNTCWPTALTESNEAQCADPNSNYSYPNMRFMGIGISKSAQTAQNLAANQAQEKALAQHVDPRIGGGDDAVILTEALCAQYSLNCGRW